MTNWKTEVYNLEGWTFGDNAEMADRLAAQTAQGKNLANCFLWTSDETMPAIGDKSYIMNSKGDPVCVVEVTTVRKLPFLEVDNKFSTDEGYTSLEIWREDHRNFFSRQLASFDDHTLVVCQRFKLLHAF